MNRTLPPSLESKLANFRHRVWTVKLAEAFLAACFGLAVSYLVVFSTDRFWETPGSARLAVLIAGASALVVGVPLKGWRWIWRQRRLEDAARLLRRTHPQLGDQLLGIVELSRSELAAAGRSERLVQAAMAQAAEAVADRDFTDAVPNARHRQWAWAAGCALALVAVAFIFAGDAAGNALARWIAPMAAIERFTFATVDPLPDRIVVPYAEASSLSVKLRPGSRWRPAHGSVRLGALPWITAAVADGVYQFALPPQKQDATLRLWVGDVRKSIRLEPRLRPELAGIAIRVRLPAYLGYHTEPRLELRGGAVTVLRGAQVAFEAKAGRALIGAALDGKPQTVAGDAVLTGYERVSGDAEHTLTWRDRDGLAPREPLQLKIHAVDDEPPRVLARRDSQEEVVLDSEVVTFDVAASDDFGVKRIGLEWTDGKTPVTGERPTAAGGFEKREVSGRATFCAVRDGVAPQTLEVRAWAEDYLPGRARSHSAVFTLHILSKTDHALWLTAQFGKWLDAARESYEREQQLHQTNKELRALSAAELDRPENRRRVAQQSAAESANAERLDTLNRSGKSLVEQATRNDQFDARRLEAWAKMLKTLKEIAANRMPSVADLLKQSANAPGGKLASGNSTGTPQKSQQSAQAPQPGASATPALPSLSMRAEGIGKPPEPKQPGASAASKSGAGAVRLPGVTLPSANDKQNEPPKPESPAEEKLEGALRQQKELLAEFAKVSDRFAEILSGLEASTFVQRLKAAARQQITLAGNIAQKTLDAFGIEKKPQPAAAPIAKSKQEQSRTVSLIENDIEAYYQRKQEKRFKTVLEEMKKTEIVRALARDGDRVTLNLTGQSMIASEYWADTLDRWAEQLVAAAADGKSSTGQSGDSLPPEIVLKVMQVLRDELKLRDETREAENAKAAVEPAKHGADAQRLSKKQAGIGDVTRQAIGDIRALPNSEKSFAKEMRLLDAVSKVMEEARGILATPETGPKAVAAETEIIERLLEAKRGGKGGGGGGSNPGSGGRAESASSALGEIGPDSDANPKATARPVGQATGRAGREFPDEFKTGLDTYFNLLEDQNKP